MAQLSSLTEGIPFDIPARPADKEDINRAPVRPQVLTAEEKKQAVANILRYFPSALHTQLAPEFRQELDQWGRIYAHRYRPSDYEMFARPLDAYPAQCPQAAAIMMMITNNLDPQVAQHPYELITYGGNGSVFQNWVQYRLTMQYLSRMTEHQTLVLYSGHPLGLFPSHPDAPRVVITNGMTVPHYGGEAEYERLASLGVTMYGQMTAGSFMYIGPQGIVHGTTLTLLNAGRLYLQLQPEQNLAGKVFLSSGLGGMSGAQAKAAVITGAIGVIAEINPKVVSKRHRQGWVQEVTTDLDQVLLRVERATKAKEALSLAYLGNVVDLLEHWAKAGLPVDLGSDQTSLHIPYTGGYYPVGMTVEDAQTLMRQDPPAFRERVHHSLQRQYAAICTLADRGMTFWDYGNSFLYHAQVAGASGVCKSNGQFRFPSYVEDIMGPMFFDFGFGPFRWICTSQNPEDLHKTDALAARVLSEQAASSPPHIRQQILDNLYWIRHAAEHHMVVGSQARILYSDAVGRVAIARAFQAAIRSGDISAPIVLGRDHHDVSGTDSPLRETANIRDGSQWCADMAVQNVIGDSFRGATWVSLHNGGGVGWGKAINGGFGLLLDGSPEAERRMEQMLFWDVNNGVTRRAWAGNPNALLAIQQAQTHEPLLQVTLPHHVDPDIL